MRRRFQGEARLKAGCTGASVDQRFGFSRLAVKGGMGRLKEVEIGGHLFPLQVAAKGALDEGVEERIHFGERKFLRFYSFI